MNTLNPIDTALQFIINRSPLARMDASWALMASRDTKEREFMLIWEKAKKDKNAYFSEEERELCEKMAEKHV